MGNLTLLMATGYTGTAVGASFNANLSTTLQDIANVNIATANGQAYVATLPIVASATTTLNLLTGLTNPLGDAITGAAAFAHVNAVYIIHDPNSLASSIKAFGGASGNLFQGYLNSTGSFTLPKSGISDMSVPTTVTGMVVDATHKNIDITNNDGVNAATVRVAIFGTTN